MTIDNAIGLLERGSQYNYYDSAEDFCKAYDMAIEIMRKYQMMQTDYEARLRADMMAILKEMRAEMEYVEPHDMGEIIILNACKQVVDTRINSLKEQKDGTNEKTSDR